MSKWLSAVSGTHSAVLASQKKHDMAPYQLDDRQDQSGGQHLGSLTHRNK